MMSTLLVTPSLNSKEDQNTISLMKLFQDNVKQDISNTSTIIELIQSKLRDCDLSLHSLKTSTSETLRDFTEIENKIQSLDTSLKRVDSFSSLSRSDSMASFSSYSSLSSLSRSSSEADFACSQLDSDAELEKTFVFVTSMPEVSMSDEQADPVDKNNNEIVDTCEIAQLRKREYKLIDKNCNELIELLFKSACVAE